MPRHQRILSETGTYHVMMRGTKGKTCFWTKKINRGFLRPCLLAARDRFFSYIEEGKIFLEEYLNKS